MGERNYMDPTKRGVYEKKEEDLERAFPTHRTVTIYCGRGGLIYLQNDEGEKIATVHGPRAVKAECAHRLGLCWNTHDGLLHALEQIASGTEDQRPPYRSMGPNEMKRVALAAIKAARP